MSDINTYNDCINIIEDKKKLNNKELLTKWESFKTKFPQLYQMLIMTETVDLKLLKFLCDTAEKQKKAIELSESKQKNSDLNQKKLREHAKNHAGGMQGKHIRNMVKFMKAGDSFNKAHKKAKKLDK